MIYPWWLNINFSLVLRRKQWWVAMQACSSNDIENCQEKSYVVRAGTRGDAEHIFHSETDRVNYVGRKP